MEKSSLTHLKCITNGRVFIYTDILAQRSDMVACNAKGEIAKGHYAETNETASTGRRVTKFLGSTSNGVLYPYTEFLAARSDMVSIDSEEQWEQMQELGKAPEKKAGTIAPALSREQKVDHPPAVEKPPIKVSSSLALPVIEGLGAREAKTVLSEWADKNFGKKLDRRVGLEEVVETCQAMIAEKQSAEAAAG
ncbi:MAG TPA: hypothetical protein ENJ35_04210 [Gammaproteobacteria bacterium]|nr:hypothetical protein [Gammaproteobacteria bacterium]